MRRPSRSDATVIGRYALMQLPSGFLIALVLALLVDHEQISSGFAYALFGLWVVVEIALFPVLRVGYEVGTAHAGAEALLGAVAVAQDDLDPEGNVRLGAERWRAVAEGIAFVPAGARVRVREVRELTLIVEPVEAGIDAVSDPPSG
jgi:membrane protein implicated in regulation of membrane protease activity